VLVVLIFQRSANMEAAYGLAINLTFLMTTVLLTVYLYHKHVPKVLVGLFVLVYLFIEGVFLTGNAAKITHGGWFTILLAAIVFTVMLVWWWARRIKNNFVPFVEIENYYGILSELSEDESVPRFASQLVYLTSANFKSEIESKIMYSILQKKPKRADIYW